MAGSGEELPLGWDSTSKEYGAVKMMSGTASPILMACGKDACHAQLASKATSTSTFNQCNIFGVVWELYSTQSCFALWSPGSQIAEQLHVDKIAGRFTWTRGLQAQGKEALANNSRNPLTHPLLTPAWQGMCRNKGRTRSSSQDFRHQVASKRQGSSYLISHVFGAEGFRILSRGQASLAPAEPRSSVRFATRLGDPNSEFLTAARLQFELPCRAAQLCQLANPNAAQVAQRQLSKHRAVRTWLSSNAPSILGLLDAWSQEEVTE